MASSAAPLLPRVTLALALASAALLAACSQSGGGPVACELSPPPASGTCANTPTAAGEPAGHEVLDSGVTVDTNLTYQSDAGVALQGDLYLPPGGPTGKAGIVVLLHGGGWSDCARRRDAVAPYAEQAAQEVGAGVFNVDYRLTQEGGGYPNNLKDVYCAVEWIAAQAAGLHLDPHRVALVGESVGGQLALDAALNIYRTDLDPGCGPMPAIAEVVSYSAPTNLPALAASSSPLVDAVKAYAGPCDSGVPQCDVGKACDRCVDASPAAHACVSGDATRYLLVQAPTAYDPIVPYSQVDELASAFSLVGASGHLIVPTGAQLEAQGCAANDASHPAHGMLTPCLPAATHDSIFPELRAAVGP